MTAVAAHLIYPHQLFEATLSLKADLFVLVEDDLFFRQYTFHKQKLIMHRASMAEFAQRLEADGRKVIHLTTGETASRQTLADLLRRQRVTVISYYDLVDDWLEQAVAAVRSELKLSYEVYASPGFLTDRGQIDDYFDGGPSRMQHFYEWQRKRLDVLMQNGKPVGGKWSFDASNRKRLPAKIELPAEFSYRRRPSVTAAAEWVAAEFADNPGSSDLQYPVTHQQAAQQLRQFLEERLNLFGPYEDALSSRGRQLFHSVLSAPLNIGLLTPRQVLEAVLAHAERHEVPIESLEGFVRQLTGWREYMRATYVTAGRSMRTRNQLGNQRRLGDDWWRGTTGLMPVDDTIRRVLDCAYAHHIERLMVLGNAMLLLRIHPDEVYEWFMSLFIDAYDWVMVPNVYAMSQFAAGSRITTKPYVSGSNYIIKMSDYRRADWSLEWDALYWRFIDDQRRLFLSNPRANMMVALYDKLPADKRRDIHRRSDAWLKG